MKLSHTLPRFTLLRKELIKKHQNPISMFFRLFTFLCLFLFSIILGVFLILLVTGVFNSGAKEYKMLLHNELTHLTEDVSKTYGKYSVLGISLSQSITDKIEKDLSESSLSINELKTRPDLIESILDSQMDLLVSSIKYANTSGIFIILDTSVNSNIKDSNSGIFLKSTNANLSTAVDSSIRYLRGPAKVARSHKIELLPQWQMEFTTSDIEFYKTTIKNARNNPTLPLAQLYYWSPRVELKNCGEPSMLLCVPLITKHGTVYGVCGFEVSSMCFKTMYSPDNSAFSRIFSVLAPNTFDTFHMEQGLLAGNYYQTNYYSGSSAEIQTSNDYNRYHTQDQDHYSGLDCEITLYPSNSVYAQHAWSLAVLIPEQDLDHAIRHKNQTIFLLLLILLIVSLVLAIVISKFSIRPVIQTMHSIKTQGAAHVMKTNIFEIDDLLDFLSKQDEVIAKEDQLQKNSIESDSNDELIGKIEKNENTLNSAIRSLSALPDLACTSSTPLVTCQTNDNNVSMSNIENVNLTAYTEFIHNIETLSKAERAVFNLYMEGYTANEITKILYLSINTIKTHNKRIYMKLNVSSRKELLVYVQMMKHDVNTSN